MEWPPLQLQGGGVTERGGLGGKGQKPGSSQEMKKGDGLSQILGRTNSLHLEKDNGSPDLSNCSWLSGNTGGKGGGKLLSMLQDLAIG